MIKKEDRPSHEVGWKNYLFGKAWSNIAWFFVGGIAGTCGFALFYWRFGVSLTVLKAALTTLGLMILKESADEISSYFECLAGKWGLDAAGGDFRDLLLGLLGILFAVFVIIGGV